MLEREVTSKTAVAGPRFLFDKTFLEASSRPFPKEGWTFCRHVKGEQPDFFFFFCLFLLLDCRLLIGLQAPCLGGAVEWTAVSSGGGEKSENEKQSPVLIRLPLLRLAHFLFSLLPWFETTACGCCFLVVPQLQGWRLVPRFCCASNRMCEFSDLKESQRTEGHGRPGETNQNPARGDGCTLTSDPGLGTLGRSPRWTLSPDTRRWSSTADSPDVRNHSPLAHTWSGSSAPSCGAAVTAEADGDARFR